MPRIILLISFKKMVAILSSLVFILFMAGCGGGGGGGDEETPVQPLPGDSVIVAGTVDDGTPNSPIMRAKCAFVDLNGDNLGETTADNIGRFSINVLPDKEGYIRCSPPDIPKLILSTFLSTKGLSPEDKISGEDVTPTTTVVADIIDYENATIPLARKLELLNAIENEDPELSLLVKLSKKLCKAMLVERINVPIGSDRPGEGGAGGGGAGGDAGDGGDFSPIPNAVCDFAIDLEGEALFSAALEDLRDGELNRPDLAAIKGEVDPDFQDPQTQQDIKEAFEEWFPAGVGKPYSEEADGTGKYFLPIPPNVQGFVRCTPPNQPQLKLATFVPKLEEGEKVDDQDVTPATTFFSHSIATKLSDDLSTVKENYLDDTAGLGDIHIATDGEGITGFELKGEPANKDVGLVAFSATSLFNILYKNEIDVDYLAALDGLIDNQAVDPKDLESLGIPKEDAEKWSELVNKSNNKAGEDLGTNLNKALSKARIKVTVIDKSSDPVIPIQGAKVNIPDPPDGVVCENCGGETDEHGGVTLILTGVPTDAIQIEVEASSVAGFEPITKTTKVVAFATVDLEIALSYKLTVLGDGSGNGTVTSSVSGISCDISAGYASGDYSAGYEVGSEVILTAEPLEDSTFDGWSGVGCSGTGDCTVTMNKVHEVIAKFTLKKPPPCTYSILPASQPFGADGGTGSISVTSPSGCDWSASESVSWITITSGSSGSGDGTVSYTVDSNPLTATREATITVAGKSYTVTQGGVGSCTYSIVQTSLSFKSDGGTGSISVKALAADCSWTASESASWIKITSGSSGSGDGTVVYSVDPNPLSATREATITVAGKSHKVTQEGVGSCTYSIVQTSLSFKSDGGTGSISVKALAADCSWTASESASWIKITSGSSGSGDGTVVYSVDPNPLSATREATITLAGKSHKVTQEGVGSCTYSIVQTSLSFKSDGGTGSISVKALAADCSWTASESASWIKITSGSSGSGDGTVIYSVDPNPLSADREATITVAGKSHKVTQEGVGSCTYSIVQTSLSFKSDGGTGSISVKALAADCSWTASESASWIKITSGSSGSGDGTVVYSVDRNPLSADREATITVAGKSHKVTQAGVECIYSISPTSKSFDGRGGLGRISVSATSDCGWKTSGVPSWIAITSGDGSGSGNGEVTYWVYENFGTSTRTATLTVAGNSHTVTQTPCSYSISPTSKSFPSSGGTGAIDVDSTNTCAWSVSANASWITITEVNNNSSGHFNGEISYTVSANTGTSSRTATITLAGKSHTVTQEAPALLTVQGGSTGTGFVSSTPSGFSCSIDGTNESGVCSRTYSSGTEVTLLADPSGGSTIDGWSVSSCGTATSCKVIMDQALSVTILFKAPPINFTLTVEVDPREGGIVTSTPPGINCPTDCSEIYKSGTEVELTADPAAGFTFDGAGWSGDCDLVGTDFCDLTMTRNRTVTASFDRFISSQLFATEVVTDQLWIIDKQSGSGRAVGKIDVSDGAVGLACDENSNTLYGVDSPLGADSVLLKIEPNTGRTEKIGNIGFDAVKGLAFDSVSRILYGVTYLNEVLRIDPRTGEGILIGRPGTSFLDSLAYNPQQGVLYAVDINKDILYVIDPQKGTGNAVGPTGFINVSGLAYDRTTNTLYGAARGSGQLIEINTRTGSGQVVGRMPNTGFNGMTACLQ